MQWIQDELSLDFKEEPYTVLCIWNVTGGTEFGFKFRKSELLVAIYPSKHYVRSQSEVTNLRLAKVVGIYD